MTERMLKRGLPQAKRSRDRDWWARGLEKATRTRLVVADTGRNFSNTRKGKDYWPSQKKKRRRFAFFTTRGRNLGKVAFGGERRGRFVTKTATKMLSPERKKSIDIVSPFSCAIPHCEAHKVGRRAPSDLVAFTVDCTCANVRRPSDPG